MATGYYTFREAAQLASFGLTDHRLTSGGQSMRMRITPSRLRGWFRSRRPAFVADYRPRIVTDNIPDGISFHALLDATMAARLLERGVSFREVRRAHAKASEILGTPHPFARREVRTDGRRVYLVLPSGHLEEVVAGRYALEPVIGPYLSSLHYDAETGLADQWGIATGVRMRPRVRGGAPVAAGTGIPTYILAEAASANAVDEVAWWYMLPVETVQHAIDFETRLAEAA